MDFMNLTERFGPASSGFGTADFGANGGPRRSAMLLLLSAFAVIWASYLSIANAPFAILHDMSEAYVWGREFQLGYNQHPPFWAWICGAWFLAFPRTTWAFAILGVLNATIGLAGSWMLIGDFAAGPKRWAAFVLLLLTPFYTFGCFKYDANTIFLSIWPWTLHFFYRSLQQRQTIPALLLGLCAGLALMSKYYAVILIATCLLAAWQSSLGAQYFSSSAPWISAMVATAICVPHVIWLLTHRAPPLRYLASVSGRGLGEIAGAAAQTGFAAVWMNLAVLALVAWVMRPSPRDLATCWTRRWADRNFRVLAVFALAPLALTLFFGLALRTQLTPEMTVGTFTLAPLLAIELSGARNLGRLARLGSVFAAATLLALLALSPLIMLARTWLWSGHSDTVLPYQELATEATRIWRAKTSLPLSYVAGQGHGFEDAIAFYSPDRPHAFFNFDYSRNLWVTPERLATGGLLTACLKSDGACLASTADFLTPSSTQTEISVAHVFWRHVAKAFTFVVTVIPPRDCKVDPTQETGDCRKTKE
jgi:hypothetical protein